jgi:multiple antibiotic resistance protein
VLDDENHLVTQFLTLWAMLDPISHLPLFLAATVDLSGQEKRRAAVRGVVFAFFILIFFGVAGELLLAAMGISLMSFQIAGGIILLVFSISMVLGDQPTAAKSPLDPMSDAVGLKVTRSILPFTPWQPRSLLVLAQYWRSSS